MTNRVTVPTDTTAGIVLYFYARSRNAINHIWLSVIDSGSSVGTYNLRQVNAAGNGFEDIPGTPTASVADTPERLHERPEGWYAIYLSNTETGSSDVMVKGDVQQFTTDNPL